MEREEFHELFEADPKPIAHEDEMFWLFHRLKERIKPLEVVVEVGVSGGGSLKFWREIIKGTSGLIVGLDLKNTVPTHWSTSSPPVIMLEGDCRDERIKSNVKGLVGNIVDFLYIDGHHELENIQADYDNYSPLVRKGGAIGFHDLGTRWVRQVFDSIEGEKEENIRAHGTGVIFV